MDNAMFLMWIEEQLNLLRPASSARRRLFPDPAEEIPHREKHRKKMQMISLLKL